MLFMSCFIKAIIEYYKREHGYDPSDPVAKRRAARPLISLSELLKKYPAMKLDPPVDGRTRRTTQEAGPSLTGNFPRKKNSGVFHG